MAKFKSEAPRKRPRHDPLAVQLAQDELGPGKVSALGRRNKRNQERGQEAVLDSKASQKILAIAKEQQDEMAQNSSDENDEEVQLDARLVARQVANGMAGSDDDEGEEWKGFGSGDEEQEEYEEIEIDDGDQAILDSFGQGGSRNLADLIMQKLEEHEQANQSADKGKGREQEEMFGGLDPKIIEVYTKVGQLLSRYKSGPLPKAFKIIPSLRNWFQILEITQPESWTPHATLSATRIFASNLDPKHCQKFYRTILYERVREEIGETGKLTVQLYMALKKAIYKPAAFFKGLLFPLCESGTCTLKEAVIIGSVLTKVSIPVLHSAAALMKLADMEYTGPTSVFIRVLLDKKYALPYKVVDALVFHFIRFKREQRQLPVLWHQSFLVFVQRYKADLTAEQKEALLDVLRVKVHAQITPEIRREIVHSVARGEEVQTEDVEML
ncbi:Bystin-domain-containing protein [Melampsora americana]|nr:Bystin-domain-containing protein [Melampsora americana]